MVRPFGTRRSFAGNEHPRITPSMLALGAVARIGSAGLLALLVLLSPLVLPTARGQAPAPGDLLLEDDFEDPELGWLPLSAPSRSGFSLGYEDGEYVIRKANAREGNQRESFGGVNVPGRYSDASFAVDIRLVGDPADQVILLLCRLQRDGESAYGLIVLPWDRMFALSRLDNGEVEHLVELRPSSAIRRGNATNRLELTCAGDTISAAINGTPVASVQDDTYGEGQLQISVFWSDVPAAEARLDNLAVTQQ